MNWKEYLKGFRFFWKGLQAAGREMWVSLEVLIALTLVLSTLLFFVEHAAQPEVYTSWWDAFVWSFMGYLGNPGKFAPGDPITLVGRFLWIAIAIVKIMIFAVPAGLVASGFSKAMAKEKRDNELVSYRDRLRKAFRRNMNRTLREYLNTLPNKGGDKYKTLNFVPSKRAVGWIQSQKGMSEQDIIDTVNKFPEFRMSNMARALSDEDDPADRFLVEHFPINRPYGCCINRESKITIVSTSSYDELNIGWFTYYLAKFGGFNYVSKELEVDIDETDSFYNYSDEPLYNKKKREIYDDEPKKNKKILSILDKKTNSRKAFVNDIKELAKYSKDCVPWIVLVNWHIKNRVNTVDFHFVDNNKNGTAPTVIDTDSYNKLFDRFCNEMKTDLQLESVKSTRYPFLKNNLLYYLKEYEKMDFNGFALRPSSEIVAFDSRRLEIAFRMAQIINEVINPGGGMHDKDIDGFKTGFGYQEQKVDEPEVKNFFVDNK